MNEKKESGYLLCSECFNDEGLRIDAISLGIESHDSCPNCNHTKGKKLSIDEIYSIISRYFVRGTIIRGDYGAAPTIQFNEHHFGQTEITPPIWLLDDIKLLEKSAKIGLFYYGPRLWMIGEVEPLKELQDPTKRANVIQRILDEYPQKVISQGTKFYRLRVNPNDPNKMSEYDSPPDALVGNGRLDSVGFPVMYGSQDLDICIHECRATIEDDIFVATLETKRELRLLDLTHLLEESVTEFESLDMAIHMLFMARSNSYGITRHIAQAAKAIGIDGIIYPSFFSLIRTGGTPFETVYGLSLRHHSNNRQEYAERSTIPNFAIFDRPLQNGLVDVRCIDRVILTHIGYRGHFGPVGIN
jgi:hypothetical protein